MYPTLGPKIQIFYKDSVFRMPIATNIECTMLYRLHFSVSEGTKGPVGAYSFPCIFETLFTMLHFTVIVMSRLQAENTGCHLPLAAPLNAILELLPFDTREGKRNQKSRDILIPTAHFDD